MAINNISLAENTRNSPDIYIDTMQCQFFYEELWNHAGFLGENLSNLETGSENLVQLSAISTAVSGSSRYTKMFLLIMCLNLLRWCRFSTTNLTVNTYLKSRKKNPLGMPAEYNKIKEVDDKVKEWGSDKRKKNILRNI